MTKNKYIPHGASKQLFSCEEPEVLIEGPAGTGKTRSVLEKAFMLATHYPNLRILFLRQTHVSLTQTVLITWRDKVVPKGFPLKGLGAKIPDVHVFPNGTQIVWGGLVNPDEEAGHRIMSGEYDIICVFEATENRISDYEKAITRLRNNQMPFQQVIADCNPATPGHWLNRRAQEGGMVRLKSIHEDNPMLWDHSTKKWTRAGANYINMLNRLTGVRRKRLLLGIWSAVEGMVYPDWDTDRHIMRDGPSIDMIARNANRVIASKDWGFRDPGVTQVWAVDRQRRMTRICELYMTGRGVDWWLLQDKMIHDRFNPWKWVADPSRPEFIEQYQRNGIPVQGANNNIELGVQKCEARLATWLDGKPGLLFHPDSQFMVDSELVDRRLPKSSEDEFESYLWPGDGNHDGARKEKPLDKFNHGMDAMRYAVMLMDYRPVSQAIYRNRLSLSRDPIFAMQEA
jgi:hypothetical protein